MNKYTEAAEHYWDLLQVKELENTNQLEKQEIFFSPDGKTIFSEDENGAIVITKLKVVFDKSSKYGKSSIYTKQSQPIVTRGRTDD